MAENYIIIKTEDGHISISYFRGLDY